MTSIEFEQYVRTNIQKNRSHDFPMSVECFLEQKNIIYCELTNKNRIVVAFSDGTYCVDMFVNTFNDTWKIIISKIDIEKLLNEIRRTIEHNKNRFLAISSLL